MTTCETVKRWLTVADVAGQLSVSDEKVLQWIETAELRAHDLSNRRHLRPRWKIKLDDLEAFLARRATTPPPDTRRRRRQAHSFVDFYPE
jgi:excisionase family DNA binding protein